MPRGRSESPFLSKHFIIDCVAKCAYCFKEFEKVGRRKYCSDACKARQNASDKANRHRVEKTDVACEVCRGKITESRYHKYCSSACRYKHKKDAQVRKYHASDPHLRTCMGCKKPITIFGWRRCCSRECHAAVQARKNAPRTCRRCESIIAAPKSHRYCSTGCRLEYYAECRRVPRTAAGSKLTNCNECGAELTELRQFRYCSNECRVRHTDAARLAARRARGPLITECLNCQKAVADPCRKYCSNICRLVFYTNKRLRRMAIENRRAELIRKEEKEERQREEKERGKCVA